MQEVDCCIVFYKLGTACHVDTGIVRECGILEQIVLPVDIWVTVPLLGIKRIAVLLYHAHRQHVGPCIIAGHHELALDGAVADHV